MISRPLLAIVAVALLGTACGSDVGAPPQQAAPEAVTTTIAYDPEPSVQRSDTSELPPLERAVRFNLSRARIAVIEGYALEDAKAWATESGWETIRVLDLDHPSDDVYPAVYDWRVIGLSHQDGVVVEAWTGG